MLNIEIDGRKLEVEEGSMVIEAADAAGIYIPRFCYHKKLSVAANCRMCLVEVEKVGKPLPACATPVTEGMKVHTHSAKAVDAQKGVMEFLLINHPLDCPICDQGGECQLQDLAVGYGGDVSRFQENKRVVMDKYIGPLIATDMTRCIHCTRCVRFGQEIAGLMELGATGRGEHMRIGTYIENTVDSELSGNMIDLCPVGALTSRPFRYSARGWELQDHASVSPHDCVGSNLTVQARGNKVMRVLPRENEGINETWLSDRDRYSYTALDSSDRLSTPMIRRNGELRATDWTTALEFAAAGLRKLIQQRGADSLGALAAPTSTVEEFYLLQKLTRALGSGNVDHRLRARDFSDDEQAPLFPWLGQSIQELEDLDTVLLIGSNVRKDQPLIAHRLRKAFLKGAKVMAVNPLDYDFSFRLAGKVIAAPYDLPGALARIAGALSALAGKALPDTVRAWMDSGPATQAEQSIAAQLHAGKRTTLLLGNAATGHAQAADLRALAELIAGLCDARFGYLPEANSAGGWLAGCLPQRGVAGDAAAVKGRNAYDQFVPPLKGYILLGTEPALDCWDGAAARRALAGADFVVALSMFKHGADEHADVLLPMAAFTETSGTYVNCEGRLQSFAGAVAPPGEARPGWKILRVLGNLLQLPGFAYNSSDEVCAEVAQKPVTPDNHLREWRLHTPPIREAGLTRIVDVPAYASDMLVRRAQPLQLTRDNAKPAARMNADQASRLGLTGNAKVQVQLGGGQAELALLIDKRVPDGCVLVAAGYAETADLGGQGAAHVVGSAP
jgi:NADH-quinone oxidoreductase subunit G